MSNFLACPVLRQKDKVLEGWEQVGIWQFQGVIFKARIQNQGAISEAIIKARILY
jgi:hypothetical protein